MQKIYRMLAEKRVELATAANKLRNGLLKIDETREKVQEMSVELEAATVQGNNFLLILNLIIVIYNYCYCITEKGTCIDYYQITQILYKKKKL